MKIERLAKSDIFHRLGLGSNNINNISPNNNDNNRINNQHYFLRNEHEVLCPITGCHQGILSTASSASLLDLKFEDYSDAESIAENEDLVSSVITAGSLAASIRNRGAESDSSYYLPFVITLVESYLADEVSSVLWEETRFGELNQGGIGENNGGDVLLYACNTQMDYSTKSGGGSSATSDVYLLPSNYEGSAGKVWRFSIEYKVVTINLNQIKSFTPQRPDVWLKDDCY